MTLAKYGGTCCNPSIPAEAGQSKKKKKRSWVSSNENIMLQNKSSFAKAYLAQGSVP
jgi:hypothetical protein